MRPACTIYISLHTQQAIYSKLYQAGKATQESTHLLALRAAKLAQLLLHLRKSATVRPQFRIVA